MAAQGAPSAKDIQAIFKRLKQHRDNKVRIYSPIVRDVILRTAVTYFGFLLF